MDWETVCLLWSPNLWACEGAALDPGDRRAERDTLGALEPLQDTAGAF